MPNYNPSPRSEFMQVPDNIRDHHILVENAILRRHLSIALAEVQRLIAASVPAENMGACAAAHLRLLGANDLLEVFYNLAETQTPAAKKDSTNLPGNVRPLKTN